MSVEVFILGGRDVGRSYTVESSARLGRAADCEIPLRDRSISRVHARLFLEDGRWFLEDEGSRNGIRHGGKLVRRLEVKDRADLLLGELPIRVCLTEGSGSAEFEFEPAGEEALAFSAKRSRPEPEELELEDEIELEGEIEIDSVTDAEAARRSYELRRREILRSDRGRGFLRGDLAQQPVWVRTGAVLLVLAFFAGLGYLAFRGVAMLRAVG